MSILLDRAEKCRGAMLATAIGDALGWPNEQNSGNQVKLVTIDERFVEWTRRNKKPCYHDEKIHAGEYSDDTQLTLAVARSIIAGNWEKHFSEKELPFWLDYQRGGGRALLKAARTYQDGQRMWQSKYAESYYSAGGNGAAMRILPHVVSNSTGISGLIEDVFKDAIITHGHPRAVLGAMCYAYALYYLMQKEDVLEYGELIDAVKSAKSIWGKYPNVHDFQRWLNAANGYYEYRGIWDSVVDSLISGMEFIHRSLEKGLLLDDTAVLESLGCFSTASGAGDVSVLAALFIASKYANNPSLGLRVSASAIGADTDTIASMVGGMLGMLCGTGWIPIGWRTVQDYNSIIQITDILLADNRKSLRIENLDDAAWINTEIGRTRRINSETVRNKRNTVVITKWRTALGQTYYTKELLIQKKTSGINLLTEETLPKEPEKQLILSSGDIAKLLIEPRFNQKLSAGKVLKIVQTLIEDSIPCSDISKVFNVKQEVVDLLKSFLK